MGMMVDGRWRPEVDTLVDEDGRLQRPDSAFRNWITADGRPGPTGKGGFAAEPGRYHLYLSRACPWAHRTAIFREFKGLQAMIGVSVTHWLMADDGWTFNEAPGVIADPVLGARTVWQLYAAAEPGYSGRISVPVLWDKVSAKIVSNESADIIRMFNSAFDGVGALPGDWYPPHLREEIDALNARIYDGLNNGVYKAGFASSQQAYDDAVAGVFDTLDWLENLLDGRDWLCGEHQTEADWRLFTTLLRFDAVYHGQPAPAGRLPAAMGLHPPPVPAPGGGANPGFPSHQTSLLRQPPQHQSHRHRPGRPGAGLAAGGVSGWKLAWAACGHAGQH